jgi:hypothetical protein
MHTLCHCFVQLAVECTQMLLCCSDGVVLHSSRVSNTQYAFSLSLLVYEQHLLSVSLIVLSVALSMLCYMRIACRYHTLSSGVYPMSLNGRHYSQQLFPVPSGRVLTREVYANFYTHNYTGLQVIAHYTIALHLVLVAHQIE